MKRIAIALASLLVVACASSPKAELSHSSQANDKNNNIATNANAAPASATANSVSSAMAERELNKLASAIQKLETQSDYFDYKKFAVKPEYKNVLQKEAEFIKEGGFKVQVQQC